MPISLGFEQAMDIEGGEGENYRAKKRALKLPVRGGDSELRGPKMTN